MTDQPIREEYRDHLATVDAKGKRIWVYPKKPKGRYTRMRAVVSWFLLLLLFTAPFLRVGGEPLLLLNVLERKFILIGKVFWPQDFHLFVFIMISAIVFIILFTVVFGRLFCGWVCPQTIFMEMVFRRIEYWIEGDYKQQRQLDKQPWDVEKIRKKGSKHALFALISFAIGNTFLAYVIGSDELVRIVTEPIGQHLGGLSAMIVFSGLFYGVFAKLREQVCTTICPYGRLQGVLLDRNSMVVAYNHKRGEGSHGRAKFRKGEDRVLVGKGDCIDCHQCVDVCPTGIDIRNGTQLECVNCTACMDACDFMMESVNLRKGLIGYKSEESIATGHPFHFTARAKAYSVVLGILSVVVGVLLFSRTDVETTVLRTPGMMYQKQEDGRYSNLYNYKVINKTNHPMNLQFKLEKPRGELRYVGDMHHVDKLATLQGAFFVILDREALTSTKTSVVLKVYEGERLVETVNTNFMGPAI